MHANASPEKMKDDSDAIATLEAKRDDEDDSDANASHEKEMDEEDDANVGP